MNSGNNIVYLDPTTISFSDQTGGKFLNPRHFYQGHEGGIISAQGLDNESMQQLFSDIMERGILDPLIIRIVDGQQQLVDGERRLRCALKGKLSNVPCHVYENMSDEEAWKIAWRANDTAKSIGENATAALVKHWRQNLGFDDAKILQITNRTSQWLRQMDILGNLDTRSFDAYAKGLVSLRVALQLSQIRDLSLRQQLLNETLEDAQHDHDAWVERQKKLISRMSDRVETAEAILVAAEIMGSPESQKNAQQEVVKAEEALAIAHAELEDHQNDVPQAKNKNLSRASRAVGTRKTTSSLTKAKLEKSLEKIDRYITDEGYEGDDFVGELDHLHIIRHVIDTILSGSDDFKKMLEDYYNSGESEEIVEEEEEIDDSVIYDELRRRN